FQPRERARRGDPAVDPRRGGARAARGGGEAEGADGAPARRADRAAELRAEELGRARRPDGYGRRAAAAAGHAGPAAAPLEGAPPGRREAAGGSGRMSAQQQYLGEILVRRGVVPADRLEPLFETVKERGQQLAELLVSTNVTDEQS